MNKQELAKKIVGKILEDLEDRKGFKHLLESIRLESPDIYEEIQESLIGKVENNLTDIEEWIKSYKP